MQAMFWKEWREQRWKVLAIWGVLLGFHILRVLDLDALKGLHAEINGWFRWSLVIPGVLMGVDVVCREKDQGTLRAIKSYPLSTLQILLPKASMGILAVLGAAVLTIGPFYLLPSAGIDPTRFQMIQATAGAPLLGFVWLHFLSGLGVYGLAFMGSLLTDQPVKAIFCTFVLLICVTVPTLVLRVWIFDDQIALLHFFSPFESSGLSVLAANSMAYIFAQTVFVGLTLSLNVALCIWLFRRYHWLDIGWSKISLFGIGIVAVYMGIIELELIKLSPKVHYSKPLGMLAFEKTPRTWYHKENRVYVGAQDAIHVVDVTDVTRPERVDVVRVPNWKIESLGGDGKYIAAAGWHQMGQKKSASVSMASLDQSAVVATHEFDDLEGVRKIGPVRVVGEFICLSMILHSETRLYVLKVNQTSLDVVSENVIDKRSDFKAISDLWLMRIPEASRKAYIKRGHIKALQLSLDMRSEGHLVYVAATNDLIVFEVTLQGRLIEKKRVPLGDVWASQYAQRRVMALRDEKVYLTSFYPRSVVAFGLDEPTNPKEERRYYLRHKAFSFDIANGYLYVVQNADTLVDIHKVGGTMFGELERRVRHEGQPLPYGVPISASAGSVYTLSGKNLVILPEVGRD